MNRTLIWDFDGTLAERRGGWSGTIVDLLHDEVPSFHVTAEQIREHIRTGFPWHNHEHPHHHLADADRWWQELEPVFEAAMRNVGAEASVAARLAPRVRSAYLHMPAWHVYDDVLPTLKSLSERGWTHVILSNHVPELDQLVRSLALHHHVERVFNSAIIGYEKPHPAIFEHVKAVLGPTRQLWMIGDSYSADYCGADAAGIPAILVRKPQPQATRFATSLAHVQQFLP